MSGENGITLEGLAAAVEMLRGELATWKALSQKQDRLTASQLTAVNSGATAESIQQIHTNTATIAQLAGAVAGQVRIEYVPTLPSAGETNILYLVPKSDGAAPNYCDEYLWINSAWELIGTTGAMAYNGELTIRVNGVVVGTFTANQQAATAADISVPTDTADLTNGAGFVSATALAAALDLKQDTLTATQLTAVNSGITPALTSQITTNTAAITSKQDALTASQLAAANSGITSALVTQIGANQAAIATKADDAGVVHLAGSETITGKKTFTDWITTAGYRQTKAAITSDVIPTSTQYFGYIYANTSDDRTLLQHRAYVAANTLNTTLRYWVYPNSAAVANAYGGFQVISYADGTTPANFRPRGDLEPYDTDYGANLGTASRKWQTLNGINPGELSLVDQSTYVEIDTSGWTTDLGANRVYINGESPTFPGLLFIRAAGGATDALAGRCGGTIAALPLYVAPYYAGGGGFLHLCMPCPANTSIRIYTSVAPAVCRYYAFRGNV